MENKEVEEEVRAILKVAHEMSGADAVENPGCNHQWLTYEWEGDPYPYHDSSTIVYVITKIFCTKCLEKKDV